MHFLHFWPTSYTLCHFLTKKCFARTNKFVHFLHKLALLPGRSSPWLEAPGISANVLKCKKCNFLHCTFCQNRQRNCQPALRTKLQNTLFCTLCNFLAKKCVHKAQSIAKVRSTKKCFALNWQIMPICVTLLSRVKFISRGD